MGQNLISNSRFLRNLTLVYPEENFLKKLEKRLYFLSDI
ncbi:hypothetical protein LBBP_00796 [Leptospira borgpetersenii serovar Ballum]|uniref:Uncharacterized protein n=1 Tax=Leptospira borgpetersenii serovar Ballum TaxID=280505 RepID=A0A0S2IN81_LEPBO|nr:hypothetical protein LBBP_00796 [Leptospira borgpetersenii serovar Ballum]